MKSKILNFLKETKESIIEEYLQDNCIQTEQVESYGDIETTVGYFYENKDYDDAEDYAEQIIKETFEEFFTSKSIDFAGAIEKAKQILNKI